jgi:hypothetical protein
VRKRVAETLASNVVRNGGIETASTHLYFKIKIKDIMKVFTPEDVRINSKYIPDFVYDVFNHLLTEKWNNGKPIIISQEEVVNRIICKHNWLFDDIEISRQEIFEHHWLDVEPEYRNAGWNVEFDKPGYNESYKAFYTFTPKL